MKEQIIKVGNKKTVETRLYGWLDVHVCYTGYNSIPFKIDDDNYQIKCICNSSGVSVNKFKEMYINFNLKELNISEEEFLSHFMLTGHIIEFYVYYDRAKRLSNLIYAYYYEKNKKFVPDKYGRYVIVFKKLNSIKPQNRAKIDMPNPELWEG